MRKFVGVVALFAVVAMLGFAVSQARAADMTWTGWISDSACSADKAMSADHKGCAMKCVKERGASYVFVVSKDKKVVKIQNQDAVADANIGMEVNVTGNMTDDGSLHITKIEAASK
jgi:hypothetical protein